MYPAVRVESVLDRHNVQTEEEFSLEDNLMQATSAELFCI